MKILIVEDETFAFANIKNILSELDLDIEIAANTESISQSVDWLKNNPHPDLIFMDIYLADGPAFNIFKCIDIDVPVIFTTAYDKYAIEAFKVNSIDYLLKPINKNDVEQALKKFRKFNFNDISVYLNKITEAINPSKYTNNFLVFFRDRIIPIKCGDISFFYTSSNKTTLTTTDGRNYIIEKSLDSIILNLNPENFYRINRRFIISRTAIKDITIWPDSRLLVNIKTSTPEQIFISKNRASDFKIWLAEN